MLTMAEKRKISDQSPDGFSIPSSKHQKKCPQWNDWNVSVSWSSELTPVIKYSRTYEGVEKSNRSFEEITHQITNTEKLKIENDDYFYYAGFKNGLTYILTLIQQLDAKYKAILIHGNPKVGKTSLAHNLAYYLSSNDSTATVVTMQNGKDLGRDTVTEYLDRYCLRMDGWVIIDQFNVHELDYTMLVRKLHASNRKHPLIIFTSGHHAPPTQPWTSAPILLRVIDIRIDAALVDLMKQEYCNDNIQAADLLEVTRVFGHAVDRIISKTASTLSELREKVYEESDLLRFLSLNPNILWILWPKFCTASTDEIEVTEAEYFRLAPSKVEMLDYALCSKRDPTNKDTRLYVNWLQIDGDGRCNRNETDGFYVHTEYFYYFPCLKKLYDCIKKAQQISPHEKLKNVINQFHEESKSFKSGSQSQMGYYFEAIIRLKCQLYCSAAKSGLNAAGKRTVSFVEVADVLQPYNVEELCQMVEQKRAANTEQEYFWCDLTARNDQFPGYDFASVLMEDGKYLLIELFQATVTPGKFRKKTEAMENVLGQIERELNKPNTFSLNARVVPYIMCPYDPSRSNGKEMIPLRKHSNNHAQVINMAEF